jgi:SHS2 domain-containing protein
MGNVESGFFELPHTADYAISIWAPDFAGLLMQAAKGMYSLMGIECKAAGGMSQRFLQLEAADQESLLVAFLTELLFYLEKDNLVFNVKEFKYSDFQLDCHLAEIPIQSIQRTLKAVTFHNLKIKKSEDKVETVIVFDV